MMNLKRLSFIFSGVVLLVLIAATIIEKMYGSDFVYEHIYGSLPFVMLWVAFGVFSALYLIKRRVLKRPSTMLLHISFLLILAGALVTWLFGEQGTIHVRESKDVSSFVDKDERPKALPRDVAAGFCDLYVLYNDRICPLQTVAKDFTTKLYGSSSYKGLTSEQVFTGWMFYYSSWKKQPMIKIKSKAVQQILGIDGKYASWDNFYNEYNEYKLGDIIGKIRLGEKTADRKGFEEADEKYNLIMILYSGKLLKIYPHGGGHSNSGGSIANAGIGDIEWYSQGDRLPDDIGDEEWFFVRKSLDYVHEMVVKKDYDGLTEIFTKLNVYQQKKAGEALPADGKFKAEKLYNGLTYTKFAAMFCVTIGLLSFLLYCNGMINNKNVNRRIELILCAIAGMVLLYLSMIICLRWYISGYVPMSNGFETMQFMAWCSIVLSLSLRKKFFMLLPFGFLLCGLTLMVAMMGEANPRITQLMPVLSSPLLSIHVAVIMVAYSLFAFMMFNGITAVIIYLRNKNNSIQIERLQIVSRLILYPAVFCLAIGIFVGAVWANISWGRYWGWDPKEVWALITMLVYSSAIHTDSLPWFRRPVFFHWFAIIAFFTVLITYFGVNFFLGGMHSYALL